MNKAQTKLRVAGILYILSSLFIIRYVPLLGTILLVTGSLIMANSFLTLEELRKNKLTLIIETIISFVLNIPAAVLLILSCEEINTIKLETTNAPPTPAENKRIDLLLKLGIAMILVSGILFATTSWNFIPDIVKVILLLIMGVAFLGLSHFSEVTLKIESTTKAYFLLGIAFLYLAWIGAGYFEVFSSFFSFTGNMHHLFYFFTLLILGVLLYLIYLRFKEKEYLYLGHVSIYASLFFLMSSINLEAYTLTILSGITLIINFIPTNKKLQSIKEVSLPFSYLLWPLILTDSAATPHVLVITCLISLINTTIIILKNYSSTDTVLGTIASYIQLIVITLNLKLPFDTSVILFFLAAIYSLIIRYQKLNSDNWLTYTSQIIYNLIAFTLIIILSCLAKEKLIIIIPVYLIINIINSLNINKSTENTDFYCQPFVIFFSCLELFNYINAITVTDLELDIILILTMVIFIAIHCLSKNQRRKSVYFIGIIAAIAGSMLINPACQKLLLAITAVTAATYLFTIHDSREKAQHNLLYIYLLISIIEATSILPAYGLGSIVSTLINLTIFLLLTIFMSNQSIKKINYAAITIPLFRLAFTLGIEGDWLTVINNILTLYILFLFLKFLINEKGRDLVATIFLILSLFGLLFTPSLIIGLYVGILNIGIIFYTYNKDQYRKLFYTSVVLTILNIIIQLWDLWAQIPFWLYLLLVGIAIVGFVTYKESHKKVGSIQPSKPIESPPEDNTESATQITKTINFCPKCGTHINGDKYCHICGNKLQ